MPLSGPGTATKPAGATAVPITTIESSKFNLVIDDIYAIFNTPRPIAYGGTNGSSAVEGIDNLSTKGTDIASAATTDIGAATGRFVHITGTTTITSLGTKTAGVVRFVVFDGALTLTYNATSLILPGGTSITTAAGDAAIFVSEGAGNWRCVDYVRSSATPGSASGMQGYVSGLAGTTNTGTPASNIDIAAGVAAKFDSPYSLITLTSAITKNTSNAWSVGSGNGSLDTGSIANSTYYGYLIQRSDTGVVDILTSLSSTSPTMPTNYDRRSNPLFMFTRVGGVNGAIVSLVGTIIPLPSLPSTSGTSVDFTSGIPVNAKRVTVHFVGVSTSGTSDLIIQIGGASIETSGYLSSGSRVVNASSPGVTPYTTGFGIRNSSTAAQTYHGSVAISLADSGTRTWTAVGNLAASNVGEAFQVAGSKPVLTTVTRIRVTTVGGADTFDAGLISVSYEV